MKTNSKSLRVLTVIIIVLTAVVSTIGLFYTTGGKPFDVVNQYGDTVKIYGDGIYAHDSFFKAPIFRGTDFTILFTTVPLLIIALILDIKKNSLKTRLFLTSVIATILYYSACIAFGATYNALMLVYIALFSACLFGLIVAIATMDIKKVAESMDKKVPSWGVYVFLVITGIALFVAWLPDIIPSLIEGRSLSLIEVYTTEITYVLDMGVVVPVCLISLFLLRKRHGMGYILLTSILTLCAIVGIMLPMQTVFQWNAGIDIPLPALITKSASFVILALFALYFNIKFFRNIKHPPC